MIGKIDKAILDISKTIVKNIDKLSDDVGLLSQNILSQLRNLIEHIALKVDIKDNGKSDIIDYTQIDTAVKNLRANGKYIELNKFHENLKVSASHYTLDEENSERLMYKYLEKLYRLKDFAKVQLGLDILDNIHRFPLKKDTQTSEYYEKIILGMSRKFRTYGSRMERCYVQKKKTIFHEGKVYYELTVTLALSKISKFDRIIVFTKHNVKASYAVKLWLDDISVKIMGNDVIVKIATDWETSIRPCEFTAFTKIFGNVIPNVGTSTEAERINKYLTNSDFNLVDVVKLPQEKFLLLKEEVTSGLKAPIIFELLERARALSGGRNVIWYLLLHMNNKVIKNQLGDSNQYLSYLNLAYGCIPFDKMPFCSSLLQHKVSFYDIVEVVGVSGREHEVLARKVKSNTETKGLIYTPVEELGEEERVNDLVNSYNDRLYYKHRLRKIKIENALAVVMEYEDAILKVIEKLCELQSGGIKGYSNSVKAWIDMYDLVDCDTKKDILPKLFESSKVAYIYGSAGTGKTTIVEHLADYLNGLNQKNVLYLAHTNTAVDNLRRRVRDGSGEFKTITAFKRESCFITKYDLVVIDECSTVSNKDMLEVLNSIEAEMLLLVGDIYQIEAIEFGNWFRLARDFAEKNVQFELTFPYRATDKELLKLWDNVRKNDSNIAEHIARGGYSKTLDESVFVKANNDEIILCLNYDGLYGINNLNSLLQTANKGKKVEIGLSIFKVNDPVLFNDSRQFGGLFHNNLKGKILDFRDSENSVEFEVEIDKAITELHVRGTGVQLIDSSSEGKSRVKFSVSKTVNTDEDDGELGGVPFQVAYAMSIHKSQGLEYDSVKIVISNEIDEMITHNVFYTAITRTKRLLRIYWSKETMQSVISGFLPKTKNRDSCILKEKLGWNTKK